MMNRQDLKYAATYLTKIASKVRKGLPHRNAIRINEHGVWATSMDHGDTPGTGEPTPITALVPLQGAGIDAVILANAVAKITDVFDAPHLHVSNHDKAVALYSGDDQAELQVVGDPLDVWPPDLPDLANRTKVFITAATQAPPTRVRQAFERVAHAICLDDIRFNLCGVHVDNKAGVLVTTDGHRMAIEEINLGLGRPVTVPRDLVNHALRANGGQLAVELVQPDPSYPAICVAHTTRVILGGIEAHNPNSGEHGFPQWQHVVPTGDGALSVTVDRDALLKALTKLKVLWQGQGAAGPHAITLHPIFAENKLQITACCPDTGKATKTLPTSTCDEGWTNMEPDARTVDVNPTYLIDALQSLPGELVRLRWADALSPILITSDDTPESRRIVMPARL